MYLRFKWADKKKIICFGWVKRFFKKTSFKVLYFIILFYVSGGTVS